MSDPYKVLGVSPTASDEEIKKAYYALVKKYHPDNCQNDDLRELASQKMQEVNEAYELIKEWRAKGEPYGGSTDSRTGNAKSGAGSDPHTARYNRVRQLLNDNKIGDADSLLEGVPYAERSGEWCFLKGCVFIRLGRYYDAIRLLEAACRTDPGNMEYRATLDRLRMTANSGAAPAGGNSNTDACCGSDFCTTLCCANLLCNCCGGDMIRCC